MVKRPKTVGLMQDVFAADGDISRSIWRSELRLSGYRILPAEGILLFCGEFFPIVCFCWLGMGYFLSKTFPSLTTFLNAAFVGGFRLE